MSNKTKPFFTISIAVVLFVLLVVTYIINKHDDTEKIKTREKFTGDYQFTLDNFPRLDGSTSNDPLRSFIVCRLLDYTCEWQQYMDTERFVNIKADSDDINKIYDKINNSKTHDAYMKLIDGTTDIILVATKPSEEEIKYAKEKNVELETEVIALDAFVFLVNKDNPVKELTTSQIKQIYSGSMTNWLALSGNDAMINAYQREDNSGSQELMKSLFFTDIKPIKSNNMVIFGMMGLINRISYDVDGLGYSVYYYEQNMVPNDNISLVEVDTVAPSTETIKSKKYPYTTDVYAVINKNSDNQGPAYALFDWLMTKEGQEVVKESGYVVQELRIKN